MTTKLEKTKNDKRLSKTIGIFALTAILITGFSLPVNSFAAIESTILNTVEIAPPADVSLGILEDNTDLVVFQEKENYMLTSDVNVDITIDGPHDATNNVLTSTTILTGSFVNSYYVHADRVGITPFQGFSGSVTFDNDIIGVIVLDANLDASDSELGAAGTTYPLNDVNRGLDWFVNPSGNPDSFTISGNTLNVIDFEVANAQDVIRVITQSPAIGVCDDSDQLCKTVVITEHGVDDGIITVNELIQYDFTIDLNNNDGQTWVDVILQDHGFGADTAVGDGPVDKNTLRDIDAMTLDNLDCELTQHGKKSAKEKLDCIVDSIQGDTDEINPEGDLDFSDGEHASVSVTAYTDINPGQGKKAEPKREYTSCGIHSPNSGAVVEYFLAGEDTKIDPPHVLATPAIYVEVYDFADLSGDCDEDTVIDANDNCPFTSNVGQEDNYGSDLGDACEDTDLDTVLDSVDNCPETSNVGQDDFDSDGVGDACNDANDADGDEVDDSIDVCSATNPADTPIDPTNGCGFTQVPP